MAISNRLAIGLGLLILAYLVVDYVRFDWSMSLFLARKFILLIDYLQFWR